MAEGFNTKFVLLRDGDPVGVYDTSPEAMNAAENLQKIREGTWMSKDLYPPIYVLSNSTWKVVGVPHKGKLT